jgi:hypothetical protein
MMARMKTLPTLLAAVCCLTLAACAFLAVSYVALKGTADLRPVWSLLAFLIPTFVVVAVLAAGLAGTALRNPAPWLCWLLIGIGGLLVWTGWSAIAAVLSSSHFEGYALVMGVIAILEGALTILVFALATVQQRPSAGLT